MMKNSTLYDGNPRKTMPPLYRCDAFRLGWMRPLFSINFLRRCYLLISRKTINSRLYLFLSAAPFCPKMMPFPLTVLLMEPKNGRSEKDSAPFTKASCQKSMNWGWILYDRFDKIGELSIICWGNTPSAKRPTTLPALAVYGFVPWTFLWICSCPQHTTSFTYVQDSSVIFN